MLADKEPGERERVQSATISLNLEVRPLIYIQILCTLTVPPDRFLRLLLLFRFLLVIFLSFPFLPARRYASAGLCDSNVSVRLSVRHTPVLCLAERQQDREMYTI